MRLSEDQFNEVAAAYEKALPGFQERINAYVCDICKSITATIDRVPGVTPFFLPCYSDPHLPAAGLSERKLKRLTPTGNANAFGVSKRMPDGRAISARSVAYRVPKGLTPEMATIEFYRPTFAEYSALSDGPLADHIARGGLLFRKIGEQTGDLNQIEELYK